jgi:2'-5' RNA ligase
MTRKYNLALTPVNSDKGDDAVKLAQKFSGLADKYLLGEKSFPHVTLYQFEMEEKAIDNVWSHVCELWQEKPINLEFKEFSCLTFDNKTHWVSLLPDNRDVLYKMHSEIASIIGLPVKGNFDPHMTLISTTNNDYKKEVEKILSSYAPIVDAFVLSLGVSDDVGQFTEVVRSYEPTRCLGSRC